TMPWTDEFKELYAGVRAYLPWYIRSDMDMIASLKRPLDVEKFMESTANLIRDLLSSPTMQAIFGQHTPAFSIIDVIRKGEFVIVNLAEAPDLSFDEKVIIGGLLIDDVLTAKVAEENVPPSQRKPFLMAIDESGEFLGEDLQRALGAVRKYKLIMLLAAQTLATLVRGDLDLGPHVLSQCGVVMTMRQTERKAKEALADRLGSPNVSFAPHMRRVQYQGPQEWIPMQRLTIGHSKNREHSEGLTEGEQETNGSQTSDVINVQD